jgi:hypothetical protein
MTKNNDGNDNDDDDDDNDNDGGGSSSSGSGDNEGNGSDSNGRGHKQQSTMIKRKMVVCIEDSCRQNPCSHVEMYVEEGLLSHFE